MKNFYNNILENTKTWKFDPFIFIVNMLFLRNNIFLIIFNVVIVAIYANNNKYSKKFHIKSLLLLTIFIALIMVLSFFVVFFIGFDDAGSLSYEEKELILDGLRIVISVIKIVYSIINSIIFQNYKKRVLAEENN
ncbi:hypothetical protein [Fusobacterium sp.]|uniref:hypothetical protein n=1 Tax=Fusobacterium sp. TaxID=68766 RepID=UPI002611A54D|nr:hypothetical protein [Fusobacterium sp.]